MLHIPENDRNLLEKAIFLPMALTILNRDLQVVQNSAFKLKKPYLHLIEATMNLIQQDLREIKREMHKRNMKVFEQKRDEAFTQFLFVSNGYEEIHNYFNPRIRNNVESLLEYYLLSNHQS